MNYLIQLEWRLKVKEVPTEPGDNLNMGRKRT